MYVRATRVQNPPDAVEKGIAFFKEKVAPAVKGAPGNAGAILLVDRKTGAAVGITMWATAQALGASEQVGISSRTQSAAATGGVFRQPQPGGAGGGGRGPPAKGGAGVGGTTDPRGAKEMRGGAQVWGEDG